MRRRCVGALLTLFAVRALYRAENYNARVFVLLTACYYGTFAFACTPCKTLTVIDTSADQHDNHNALPNLALIF
jgi:hypothetical protein